MAAGWGCAAQGRHSAAAAGRQARALPRAAPPPEERVLRSPWLQLRPLAPLKAGTMVSNPPGCAMSRRKKSEAPPPPAHPPCQHAQEVVRVAGHDLAELLLGREVLELQHGQRGCAAGRRTHAAVSGTVSGSTERGALELQHGQRECSTPSVNEAGAIGAQAQCVHHVTPPGCQIGGKRHAKHAKHGTAAHRRARRSCRRSSACTARRTPWTAGGGGRAANTVEHGGCRGELCGPAQKGGCVRPQKQASTARRAGPTPGVSPAAAGTGQPCTTHRVLLLDPRKPVAVYHIQLAAATVAEGRLPAGQPIRKAGVV